MATSFHNPTPSFGQQSTMSPLYQRRGVPESGHSIELLPNPDFVFPARSADASPSLDSWTALNRLSPSLASQQMPPPPVPSSAARGHRQRGSASALPNFSFNPSVSAGPASPPMNTPPHSPNLQSPSTPSRGIGHRRGGSEFIGGDGKGGVGLMSTSPTKGEDILPAPRAPGRLGPPMGGPGHRHRRSGAISCHDLQTIMQPKDNSTRGGSAPATPLETELKPFFGHGGPNRRAASQADFRTSPEQTRSASEGSPPRVVPRVRVGFSDRVEYIRPLSTISSETESSMSTIRGHSVSNSLSSVISMGTASPPSARMVRPMLNTTFEDEGSRSRPQSSGDILEAMTRNRQDSYAKLEGVERPKSAVMTPLSEVVPAVSPTSAPRSPKRRSFSWWDGKKPQHTLRSSISEPSLLPSPPSSPDSVENPECSALSDELSPPESDNAQKAKKSKSWTRSLISSRTSRKSRSHGNLKAKPAQERVPTPPPIPQSAQDAHSPAAQKPHFAEPATFEPNFDVDDTVTIVSEESRPSLSISPWTTRLHADSDPMSPVIDLDAALGPFNTPQFGANTRGAPAKAQPRTRRSMHSLGYNASLNHRRTESAPELVPFDMRATKIAPTATMPDVFEEEDEEAEAEDAVDLDISFSGLSTPAVEVEEPSALGISLEGDEDETTPRKPSGTLMPHARPDAIRRTSNNSLSPSQNSQRTSSIIDVVEDFEEPRASSFTRDSDSTITPPMTAEDEKAPRPMMSLQLPLSQEPLMTPDTLTGSSFSSRHFSTSQVSLNTPRLGTATSSSTDNRSLSFGDPGPLMRMSVDDVPSLSSSRSTMTTPPQYPFKYAGPYGPEARSGSVASIPSLDEHRRRSKRASVASLSRLVGVKSKLSIETRPQSQHVMATMAPIDKTKKLNRLSKLMHFWKKQPGDSRRGSLA